MRKHLRLLLLTLTLLVVPAANAIDMNCFPGSFSYYVNVGWQCQFDPGGTQCLVCYAAITVEG